MSSQDTNKLAEQNNQQIRDATLGHLFPLKTGSKNPTARDIIRQLHRGNEVERPAANVKRGWLREP